MIISFGKKREIHAVLAQGRAVAFQASPSLLSRSRCEQSDDAIDEIKQLLPCFIAFTVSDSPP